MLQEIILVIAVAGLALLAFLLFTGRGENPDWLRHTRGRILREAIRVRVSASGRGPVAEEAESIETAWEHERARATLQEAEPDRWPLRGSNG
jgi:hypothetical protein